jgi:hypothetical protein
MYKFEILISSIAIIVLVFNQFKNNKKIKDNMKILSDTIDKERFERLNSVHCIAENFVHLEREVISDRSKFVTEDKLVNVFFTPKGKVKKNPKINKLNSSGKVGRPKKIK